MGKSIYLAAAMVFSLVAYGTNPGPSENPFQIIARANLFRLHDPPLPVQPDPVKTALPPMKLTGIIHGFGKLLAFLEVGLPPTAPSAAKISFLTLSPGESSGEIEVLNVNVEAGSAQVKTFGVVTNLYLVSNVPQFPPSLPRHPPTATAAAPLSPPSASSPVTGLNRDDAALVIEAERERLRLAGDPRANLMPPTHLTPAGAPGTEESSPPLQSRLP